MKINLLITLLFILIKFQIAFSQNEFPDFTKTKNSEFFDYNTEILLHNRSNPNSKTKGTNINKIYSLVLPEFSFEDDSLERLKKHVDLIDYYLISKDPKLKKRDTTYIKDYSKWAYLPAESEINKYFDDEMNPINKKQSLTEIPKLYFVDTLVKDSLKESFYFTDGRNIEIFGNYKEIDKGYFLLDWSIKNISKSKIYTNNCNYSDSTFYGISNIKNRISYTNMSINFGLGCFDYYKMQKVSSLNKLRNLYLIEKQKYDVIEVESEIINDVEEAIQQDEHPNALKKSIFRYDKMITLDGISYSNFPNYKGITKYGFEITSDDLEKNYIIFKIKNNQ